MLLVARDHSFAYEQHLSTAENIGDKYVNKTRLLHSASSCILVKKTDFIGAFHAIYVESKNTVTAFSF